MIKDNDYSIRDLMMALCKAHKKLVFVDKWSPSRKKDCGV